MRGRYLCGLPILTMKNPILSPKVQNRKEAIENVINYIERSRDCPIWFFDKCIFLWYDVYKHINRAQNPNSIGRYLRTIRCTGPFRGTLDYGRGLLQVNISTTYNLDVGKKTASFRLHLTNIDDCSWLATRDFENIEAADIFFDEFVVFWEKEVDEKYGMVLPTEEQLNEIIRRKKLWGQCEG